MEVVELLTKCLEMFVKGGVDVGVEHVVPDKAEIKEVEDESTEQAVLGVGDEIQNLSGRSGEERGKAWILDVHIFTVFAADVGYGLVVERLSEAVGVVAVVGAECVGEGVALGLEHQAGAAVVAKGLIDCGCGGVGRDKEHTHRRFFGLLHIDSDTHEYYFQRRLCNTAMHNLFISHNLAKRQIARRKATNILISNSGKDLLKISKRVLNRNSVHQG